MDGSNVDAMDLNFSNEKGKSINPPVDAKYTLINRINKCLTASRILRKLGYILSVESLLHMRSLILSPLGLIPKRKLSQSIFRLGLSVTGERLSTRFHFKIQHCRERQLLLLKDILNENKDTEFGKKHNFENIQSVEEFQQCVPVNTYDSLEDYVTRQTRGESDVLVKGQPISYATTSGTTGTPKYIPITKRAQLESHQNISRIFTHSILEECPEAYDGTILTIVSPAEEGKTPDGTVFGSTSGQLILSMNKVVQDKYTIPYEVLTLENYEARNYCIILLGIHNPVTMLSTANPSTLSLLAKQGNQWRDLLITDTESGTLNSNLDIPENIRKLVQERFSANPDLADQLRLSIYKDPENILRPKHYWKDLNLITCWTGGNSNVFIRDMKSWYGEVKIRDLGYLASEIRGSIPLSNEDTSGVLTIGENFFEFVRVSDIDQTNPTFLLADELEVGERYYIFFTTKAGLYRYNINDIIEVTGFVHNTPKIIFIQKGKGVTNITGEKLYEQQLLAAVKQAEQSTKIELSFFICQANANASRYEFYAEFNDKSLTNDQMNIFLNEVEQQIINSNLEYATKIKSLRLKPMRLHILGDNSLELYKNWRVAGGIREAQFKTTPLVSEDSFLEPLSVLSTLARDEAA